MTLLRLVSFCTLAACLLAAGQQQVTSRPAPGSSYQAFLSPRKLTLQEWQEVINKAREGGWRAIQHPALLGRNLILIEKGEATGAREELRKAFPEMQAVPIKRSNGSYIIPTGRYFLRFSAGVSLTEAKSRLLEAKFEIVSTPGEYTSLFVVKRSPSAENFEADLKELRKIPGVRSADKDDLILSKLP